MHYSTSFTKASYDPATIPLSAACAQRAAFSSAYRLLRTERISAGFQRIVLGGDELEGFASLGFDDHSKLFFPQAGVSFMPPVVSDEGINWGDGPRPASRDYTPLYDEARHELAFDFFIHDGGVASHWAINARVGDTLTIGGPRGSLVVPEDYAFQLYAYDESGMPALRRRLSASGNRVVLDF